MADNKNKSRGNEWFTHIAHGSSIAYFFKVPILR